MLVYLVWFDLYGSIWYGIGLCVLFGMVWYGMVWYGMNLVTLAYIWMHMVHLFGSGCIRCNWLHLVHQAASSAFTWLHLMHLAASDA